MSRERGTVWDPSAPLDLPVEIRRYRAADVKPMLAVARTVADWFDEGSFEEMTDDLDGDPGIVAVFAGAKHRRSLVLADYAGWATWYPSSDSPEPDLMELTWIAVRRDLRGRGAGRALVQAVEAILHAEGIRTIELWTVAASSGLTHWAETRAFYHALGFYDHRVDTVKQTSGGHDRLFLRKPINPI